jgi:amidase
VSSFNSHRDFDGLRAPVLTVAQGVPFSLEAKSLLESPNDAVPQTYETVVIPITGPVSIEGTVPGDTLKIDVLDVHIASYGAMVTLPGYGAFKPELASSGRVLRIDEGVINFAPKVSLPVSPMVGKLGVGVATDPPRSNTVGPHGGNMDNTALCVGASLLVPVSVAGAAVYAGDLHARQADGEACLTGLEVSGVVTLRGRVVNFPTEQPVLIDERSVMTLGHGESFETAASLALESMIALLRRAHLWSREESAMFLSIAGEVRVCQLVNPRVSAKVIVAREYLPLPSLSEDQ